MEKGNTFADELKISPMPFNGLIHIIDSILTGANVDNNIKFYTLQTPGKQARTFEIPEKDCDGKARIISISLGAAPKEANPETKMKELAILGYGTTNLVATDGDQAYRFFLEDINYYPDCRPERTVRIAERYMRCYKKEAAKLKTLQEEYYEKNLIAAGAALQRSINTCNCASEYYSSYELICAPFTTVVEHILDGKRNHTTISVIENYIELKYIPNIDDCISTSELVVAMHNHKRVTGDIITDLISEYNTVVISKGTDRLPLIIDFNNNLANKRPASPGTSANYKGYKDCYYLQYYTLNEQKRRERANQNGVDIDINGMAMLCLIYNEVTVMGRGAQKILEESYRLKPGDETNFVTIVDFTTMTLPSADTMKNIGNAYPDSQTIATVLKTVDMIKTKRAEKIMEQTTEAAATKKQPAEKDYGKPQQFFSSAQDGVGDADPTTLPHNKTT